MSSETTLMESKQSDIIKATASHQFEFPSSMSLTPTLCSILFQEFMKQILYAKGQIPMIYNELMKQIDIKSNKRLSSRGLKLSNLCKTMSECQQSIVNMFKYHYHNTSLNNDIVPMDILLLFGKSYTTPLETYSLRFYINGNDEHKHIIDDKEKRKISSIIARNLHEITKIWDKELPITECRLCVEINHNWKDSNFLLKHNLSLRFPSQKKRKMRSKKGNINMDNNLFLMNYWNKDTAKWLSTQIVTTNNKNKENDIPFFEIHKVQTMKRSNVKRDINDETSWFLSNFKIKGIV